MQTALDSPSCAIAELDELLRALPETADIAQIKELREQAEAIRQYVKSAALGLEIQNQAVKVKLAVERRAGEVLRAMQLHGGDRKSGGRNDTRLEDLGNRKGAVVPLAARGFAAGRGLSGVRATDHRSRARS